MPDSGGTKANMAVRLEEDLLIVVHNHKPPLDSEWQLYVDSYSRSAPGRLRVQLVLTAGGGPYAAQRKRAVQQGEKCFTQRGQAIPRTAVMTPSAAMRALVTLFNWMFPGRYRAFEPDDFRGALDYLDKPSEQQAKLREMAIAMSRELAQT